MSKKLAFFTTSSFSDRYVVIGLVLLLLVAGCQTSMVAPTDNTAERAASTSTVLPRAVLQETEVAAENVPSNEPTQAEPSPEPTTATTDLPTWYGYRVIATYPHDANAFTQGLLFDNNILYEGTGLYGASTLRRVNLETGEVEQSIALSEEYFGEGVTIVGDRIFQLTWKENTGFIYDKTTFDEIGRFSYNTQGWGLTYNGTSLILSDGTQTIYFLDPDTQQVTNQITVTILDAINQVRRPVTQLNELEYIEGEIYANIWQTNIIVRIDPQTGNVNGVIDLTGLLPAEDYVAGTDVLNGIAYLPTEHRLFVTGKKWPKLFEIELIEQ